MFSQSSLHPQLRFGQLWKANRLLTPSELDELQSLNSSSKPNAHAALPVQVTVSPKRILIVTGEDLNSDSFIKIQDLTEQLSTEPREGPQNAHVINLSLIKAMEDLYKSASVKDIPKNLMAAHDTQLTMLKRADKFVLGSCNEHPHHKVSPAFQKARKTLREEKNRQGVEPHVFIADE